jgi:hypothetical protein
MTDAKKNAHRLGRIFRKAPTAKGKKLSTRDWSEKSSASTAAAIEASFGVNMSSLKKIVEELTEAERIKAALGEDPTLIDEEALQRRMAKFGTDAAAAAVAAPVNDEALAKRAERFGTATPAAVAAPVSNEELSESIKKRMDRFGTAAAPATAKKTAAPVAVTTATLTFTDEEREALERRAKRFGGAN